MSVPRRIVIILLSIVAALLFLVVAVSLVITNTDFGRERVRSFAINQIENAIEGEITLRRLEGDLLRQLRLIDVAIVDTAGRPFVRADTLETGYSLLSLLRQRIILSDIRIVNGDVILDQRPGEDWNFVQIFMSDPDTTAAESAWGQWIELRGIDLVNSRIMMRSEWEPAPELDGRERAEAIRAALAGEARANVVEVPGGLQNVMDFRDLNASFARALVAHPDTAAIPIDVSSFSGIVQPFSPPAAMVHDLSGHFRIAGDSLFFYDIDAVFPSSRLQGGGVYAMEHGELLLSLEGAPVALADLRWLYPPLPEEGGGSLDLDLQMRALTTRVRARDIDLQVGESSIAGRLDLLIGDTVRVDDTDLQFDRLDTRLIQSMAPGIEIPRHGDLTGRVRLDGSAELLAVDALVAFDDHLGGTSRVRADGRLAMDEGVRFSNLVVRAEPLQADLVRSFAPDLPLRGTIAGDARVTGAVGGRMQLETDLTLRDPQTGDSRVMAAGGIDMREELRLSNVDVRFDPLRLDLFRDQVPDLPPAAALTGQLRLNGFPQRRLDVAGDLAVADPQSGISRVTIAGGTSYGDAVAFSDLRLEMDPLQLDLIRPFAEDLPPGASVTGPVRLDGPMNGPLQVAAAVTVSDPASGTSHVAIDGGVATQPEVRLYGMDIRLEPLQVALARAFAPDLELGGTLAGTARIDGAPEDGMTFVAELVHEEAGERSVISGQGEVATAAQGYVDARLDVAPVSLNTINRLAPGAGLHGSASGTILAEGSLQDLRLAAGLTFQDGGRLDATGRLDRTGAEMAYAIDARLDTLDLSAITTNAPAPTSLTGTLEADGRGTDPESMQSRLVADLRGSSVDEHEADVVRLRAALSDGLARVDSARIRLGTAELMASGDFGLTEARNGTLRFHIEADSLAAFSGFVAGTDTSAVVPRPGARERIEARVREEMEEARRDADVIYIATGRLSEIDEPDTTGLAPIPRDTLAGSIVANGIISGNVSRFDAEGEAEVDDLVFQGNYVEQGTVRFAVQNAGTEALSGSVDASTERVLAGGFAFEGVDLEATYEGARYGEGDLQLEIRQDDATDIRLDAAFMLSLERNEVQLRGMDIRLDTTVWQADGEAAIDWGGDGARVRDLRLTSSDGGRIYIDGVLPIDGPADVRLEIDRLDIAHVYALLQGESGASGLVSLDARLEGARESPRIEGEAAISGAVLDGQRVPDARLAFAYADQEMDVRLLASQDGEELAVAEGVVPIDLSLAGASQRLLDRPMQIDVTAERLPLDALPAFTDQVESVEGHITVDLSIGGTTSSPVLDGNLSLAMESLRIVPLGVRFDRIAGRAATENGVMRLDSLVAWSDGPLRISGEMNLATLTRPEFDLQVEARETWVMDTRDVRLQVDADLEVVGPMDGVEISGEVRTRRGVIYIPDLADFGGPDIVNLDDPAIFERADTLLEAQRQVVTERSELVENLQLDIDVQIDRDVWLRSSEANVEIYTPPEVGPLHVRMTGLQDMPSIEGTINTDRGQYEYASRRFTLTRGAVTFMAAEEINPILQVAAEHEVQVPGRETFNIRIVIGGTLQQPEITLESTAQPPISQSDLLSFLVFGRDASSVVRTRGSAISGQGSAGGGLVGNVAGLATQQYAAIALEALVSRVESDLSREIGVDVFRITPADLPPELFTGGYMDVLRGTEIEIGSYIAPRLFIAAQARPTFVYPGLRAEYRTRRGFEWSTSWQPRYLPEFPTLREREADRANVFGSYVYREWRF